MRDYTDDGSDVDERPPPAPDTPSAWDGWGEAPVTALDVGRTSELPPERSEVQRADTAWRPQVGEGWDGWGDGSSQEPETNLESPKKAASEAADLEPNVLDSDGWDAPPIQRATGRDVQRDLIEARHAVDDALGTDAPAGVEQDPVYDRQEWETDAPLEEVALKTAHDADTDAPHLKTGDDFRQEALDSFQLDGESEARAAECGRRLAEEGLDVRWRNGDFGSRLDEVRNITAATHETLDIPPVQVNVEELGESLAGYSKGDLIGVGAWTLDKPTPEETVKTIAHEYRHQWQDAVISGDVEHPLGEEGRRALVIGEASYASDIAKGDESYAANARETDAEAFAIRAWDEYNRVVNRRTDVDEY